MKTLMVFDLDGTLAKSKSPVELDMAELLEKLMAVMKVAVISGGAWPQFETQLLSNLPQDDRLRQLSLLPTSGTKFLRYDGQWTQLYAENFTPADKAKIIDALNKALDESGLRPEKHWGEVIEDRDSQITMSALGPGRVKRAPYRHLAQNAASIRIAEHKFSWNPFSERL
jgi:phosphomannomutase